jgi:flagellar motor switch protein FliG
MDALRWMPAISVANIIRQEHPQIGAMILTLLEDVLAGQVLPLLDEDLRKDIMYRVARLDKLDPAAMDELDQVLEHHIGAAPKAIARDVHGAKTAADILNTIDAKLEGEILDALKSDDEALGEEVSDLMLVFEHLRNVDDRSMQRLIREISTDDLMIALKGSDPELMDKFLDNMSSRAADMLVEDMEAKGPVKLAEMSEAQKKILVVAKQLEQDGEIRLGRKNDDFVS